jgi:uroporphyrinogen-III synthase
LFRAAVACAFEYVARDDRRSALQKQILFCVGDADAGAARDEA